MNDTCICQEMDLTEANPFLVCVAGTCPIKDILGTKLVVKSHSPWLTGIQGSRTSQSRYANTPSLPT